MKSAGKLLVEELLVLEWIMLLPIGHRPRLEPTIEHLGGAPVALAVLRKLYRVDEMLVQIGDLHARELLELGDGSHADHVGAVFGNPDRDARPPIAIATDVPVPRVADPVTEAVLAHCLGDPRNRGVLFGHALA